MASLQSLAKGGSWPAAGGRERPLPGSEARKASIGHRAALKKPDGRVAVMKPLTLYEYDFTCQVDGSYRPSLSYPEVTPADAVIN